MLLDRRRIRKWAKWVALALAVIFALSFLFLGIGYGGAGFNISEIFSGGCSETTESDGTQTQLDKYMADLQADPNDTTAMLGIAGVYEDLSRADQANEAQYLSTAAVYLEMVIAADPSLIDVYLRVADMYKQVGSSAALEAEVTVLNKAITVDPENPDIYIKLGSAQRSLGNSQAAALAWQRYLQLDPDGQYAALIQQQLDELIGANTPTTSGTSTTGVPGTTAGPVTTTTTVPPASTTSSPAATTSTSG